MHRGKVKILKSNNVNLETSAPFVCPPRLPIIGTQLQQVISLFHTHGKKDEDQ